MTTIHDLEVLAATDGADGQLCAQAKLLSHKNDNFLTLLKLAESMFDYLDCEVPVSATRLLEMERELSQMRKVK